MRVTGRIAVLASTAIVAGLAGTVGAQGTGPSSSQSAYVVPVAPGVVTKSILTVGDSVNNKPDGTPYRMVGIPDGLGAYDNGDGTFTVLMNHELSGTAGIERAHGQKGAFVSKWIIRKSDLTVLNGADLIQSVVTADGTASGGALLGSAALSRLCSADLPGIGAFHYVDPATGTVYGTTEKIFMNGEETGAEGRAFGTLATGPQAGTAFYLPKLGKFSWENSVASPAAQLKTIVMGLDDSSPGELYVYVGTKQNAGTAVNPIEAAGLNNGKLYGIAVNGTPNEGSGGLNSDRFTLADVGDGAAQTGAQLQASSTAAGVTKFLRPEDGAWDPNNSSHFYFVTTGNSTGPNRLYRMIFDDLTNPELGGKIEMLLDDTDGPVSMDNVGFDEHGRLLIQEDPGSSSRLAKIWMYDTNSDSLLELAEHDPDRFAPGGSSFLTTNEESSGIIDAELILGKGWFLGVVQAHYNANDPELVEGGQLFAMFAPQTVPEPSSIMLAGLGGGGLLIGLLRRRRRAV